MLTFKNIQSVYNMRRFEINSKNHFITFAFCWLLLLIGRLIYVFVKELTFLESMFEINFGLFFGLWFGYFVANPDIDIILQKVFSKMLHRWIVTHSILLPIALYWLIRPFIIPELAKEFGFCLFIPVVVHLFADFKIMHLIDDNKDGMWRMSIYPFKIKGSSRLSKNTTYILMLVNAVIVFVYSLIIFEVWTVF